MLDGISDALNGLALLIDSPVLPLAPRRGFRPRTADWLPSLVNAGRAFVAIGIVELFWILTEWPNGATAIIWTAIGVILFAPRADEAYATVLGTTVGAAVAAIFTAIIAFAVLPGLETFESFSLAIGLYLIPAGALMVQPWQRAMFTSMVGRFIPLLAPENQMSYDTVQYYNRALAIVGGIGAAALSFRLLPPLSPAFRARRLMELTWRDLRRITTGRSPRAPGDSAGSRLCLTRPSHCNARSWWRRWRWVPKSSNCATLLPRLVSARTSTRRSRR